MPRPATSIARTTFKVRIQKATQEEIAELRSSGELELPTLSALLVDDRGGREHGSASGEYLFAIAQKAKRATEIVGVLWYTRIPEKQSFYISYIGVVAAHRHQGVGSELLKSVLHLTERVSDGEPNVSCVIDPNNAEAISLFLKNAFVISRLIRNYSGASQGLFYLERSIESRFRPSGHELLIPADNLDYLAALIEGTDYFVTGITALPHGNCYIVEFLGAPQEQELLSNESSISVSYVGVLLSLATFLVGFTAIAKSAPIDVILYLATAFLFLTGSMMAFASMSGELSRLKGSAVVKLALFGNITSEFGGFYLLMYAIPVFIAFELPKSPLVLYPFVVSSFVFVLYHFLGLSILGRYVHNPLLRVGLFSLCSLTPAGAGVSLYLTGTTTSVSIFNGVLIAIVMFLCALTGRESSADRGE